MNQIEALAELKRLFPDRPYHSAQEQLSSDLNACGQKEYRNYSVFVQPGFCGEECSCGMASSYLEAIGQLLDKQTKSLRIELAALTLAEDRIAADLERGIAMIQPKE